MGAQLSPPLRNSKRKKKRRRKRKRKKRKRKKRRNKYSVIDHQDFQYGSTNEDYQDSKFLFKIQQLQTLQQLISIFCLHFLKNSYLHTWPQSLLAVPQCRTKNMKRK